MCCKKREEASPFPFLAEPPPSFFPPERFLRFSSPELALGRAVSLNSFSFFSLSFPDPHLFWKSALERSLSPLPFSLLGSPDCTLFFYGPFSDHFCFLISTPHLFALLGRRIPLLPSFFNWNTCNCSSPLPAPSSLVAL